MRLLSAIYELLIVCINKLQSTRERLMWACILLWMWTMNRTDNPTVLGIVGGWTTIVVSFYFYNKMKTDNQIQTSNSEPPVNRDPEQ